MDAFDEYQRDAARTLGNLKSTGDGYVLAALGLAGEAGELVAAACDVHVATARIAERVKKHRFHGRDLDRGELVKEAGDVLWYLAALCTVADVALGDVAEANLAKLHARYPDGFPTRDPRGPDHCGACAHMHLMPAGRGNRGCICACHREASL